jgi:branched-chain amino acid transport system ATP-binding protein
MILSLENVSFNYGGLQAVIDFSMHIERGTITSLIGPNGAGKTTVFNLICGSIHPIAGNIVLKGYRINGLSAHRIATMGVGRTFQNIRLFPSLTVREHIDLSQYAFAGSSLLGEIFGSPKSRYDRSKTVQKTEEIMKRMGIGEHAEELAVNLSYGLQRRVELARALAVGVDLILLDEPTAGMNVSESDNVMELIKGLTDVGITVLLVEHDMRVVMKSSSVVWVMNQGSIIASGSPDEVRRNPLVIEAYLGE